MRSSCGSRALYTVPKAPTPTVSISSNRPSRRWPPRGLQEAVDSRSRRKVEPQAGQTTSPGGQADQLDGVAAVRAEDVHVQAAQAGGGAAGRLAAPGPAGPAAPGSWSRLGPLVVGQEPLDLGAELGVAAAQLVQQGRTPGRVAPQGRLEDLVDPLAAFRIHPGVPPSRPRSQARANRQSLSTVVSETSSSLGDLGDGQPAEEAEVDDLGRPGMRLGQAIEGLVQGDDVQALLLEAGEGLVQGYADALPLALPGVAAAGVIDQHLAHGLGGGGEEVAAVGDVGQDVPFEQPQQRLVDQGAGLEGVAGSLVAHQAIRRCAAARRRWRDEPVPGLRAAGAGLVEEDRQLPSSFGAHLDSANSRKIG